MGEVNQAFRAWRAPPYKQAWRIGLDDPSLARVAEALRKAAEEIEGLRERTAPPSAQEGKGQ